MTEPTIDEMLESLKQADDQYGVQNYLDIRAILEQHRYPACAPMEVGHELKTIRAFVERVEKQCSLEEYMWATAKDVLAAMEAEVKGG